MNYIPLCVSGEPILGADQFLAQCVLGFESHSEKMHLSFSDAPDT